MSDKKTAIVTGASHGIGAGLVEGFLNAGYNVVATALDATKSLTASPSLILIDGDISNPETSARTVDAAVRHFGTIAVLVNSAGIYRTKPFTDFTSRRLRRRRGPRQLLSEVHADRRRRNAGHRLPAVQPGKHLWNHRPFGRLAPV